MRERFDGIQLLRGLAALLVAGFHLASTAASRDYDAGLFDAFAQGEFGVDIFFVISGFIILYVSTGKTGESAAAFLRSRFWRIFPPYWTILTLHLGALVALALATGQRDQLPGSAALLDSFLLLPVPGQIITVAWTLSVELVFYALFALFFFRFGTAALLVAMTLWVGASEVYSHAATTPVPGLGILMFTGNAEFLYGILIALALRRGRLPLSGPVLVLGLALSIARLAGWFPATGLGREVISGIPAALLVYGVLNLDLAVPRPLLVLGDASYILYLVHLLVYSIFGRILGALAGVDPYSSAVLMLAMLCVAVASAVALNRFAERPYQRWYGRLMRRRKAASLTG